MELFNPLYYHSIYLTVLSLLTILCCFTIRMESAQFLINQKHSSFFAFIFAIVFTIIVGMRPVSWVFGDTVTYAKSYSLIAEESIAVVGTKDTLFYLLMWFCAQRIDVTYFFLIIEIIYIVPILIASIKFSRNTYGILMLFIMAAFSFYSYGVNGIRNGAACSIVILAIALIQGSKIEKVLSIILLIIAYNFHHSTALPIVCIFAALFIKGRRFMFYFWLFSILSSLVAGGTIASIFTSLGFDDRLSDYILSEADDEFFRYLGFRWDFLLYSSLPIILGYYIVIKKRVFDSTYLLLLGTYIYSNSFWIMVIRASYSNRFAYLSWFLYPIVIAYPLLRLPIWPKTQGHKTSVIMIGHLAFTLFMSFIYG